MLSERISTIFVILSYLEEWYRRKLENLVPGLEGMYEFILLSKSHSFSELENSGSGNTVQEHKVDFMIITLFTCLFLPRCLPRLHRLKRQIHFKRS